MRTVTILSPTAGWVQGWARNDGRTATIKDERTGRTFRQRKEHMVFPINDALDAILLGSFLFGILFTVGAFLLGAADIGGEVGGDHSVGGDHGADHMFNITSILAFITWFGGVGYVVRNATGWNWAFAL